MPSDGSSEYDWSDCSSLLCASVRRAPLNDADVDGADADGIDFAAAAEMKVDTAAAAAATAAV